MKKRTSIFFVLALVFSAVIPAEGLGGSRNPLSGEPLELVILHTNDTHSWLAGRDAHGTACTESANCVGGMARITAAINQEKAKNDNVLVLDAGDQFQGTLFFTVNKWPMLAALDQLVPYDAMTLGNHEFDEGCSATANFIRALPFPVLVANMAPRPGCPLRDLSLRAYSIREFQGVKVGIVGLTNPVSALSAACPHSGFTDSLTALKNAVAALKKQDVQHIVVVSHLGLGEDRKLARAVEGVDLIVGGHTHSYLGPDSPDGPYPVVEYSPSGQPVLVVTASFGAEYLGKLRVKFDGQGVVLHWEGTCLRMEQTFARDTIVEAMVADYAESLEKYRSQTLGVNELDFADGMQACRSGDCLAGLIVTDALLDFGRPYGAVAALHNGGGLRAPLKKGNLNLGDALAVLPFGNRLFVREYSGAQLLAALEHGVANGQAGIQKVGSRLLQVAGMRYHVDLSKPVGQRIAHAAIQTQDGTLQPLQETQIYTVIVPSYLVKDGDGYTMLTQGKEISAPDLLDVDVLSAYIKKHSPLKMPVTGRIITIN